jgi:hypothetical protein
MFAFTVRFPGHGREPQPPGSSPLRRFGGYGEGETPGPIPNPEVKPFSADGTALETVWESRTPPDIHIDQESPPGSTPAGFPAFKGKALTADMVRRGGGDSRACCLTATLA